MDFFGEETSVTLKIFWEGKITLFIYKNKHNLKAYARNKNFLPADSQFPDQ